MIMSLTEKFSQVFEAAPEFGARAPGRINLIGEHIDYLDGFVMPMAIDRAIYSVVRPNQTEQIRVWTSMTDAVTTFSTDDSEIRDGKDFWINYPVGVLTAYRKAGINSPGFDIAFDTDLPTGAGLSSSAALETVFALAIEKLADKNLSAVERAKLCQKAEHEHAGVPCGIMDQLAVGACEAGKAIMIDCRDNTLEPVAIPDGVSIIVSDTRVKHALGDGEYKKRCADCAAALEILAADSWRDVTIEMVNAKQESLGDQLFRRARHAVTEIARVSDFAIALEQVDRDKIGKLLKASHDSLRDDYEVSCPELDYLVEASFQQKGVIGARMTGGGFGGSIITLVEDDSAPALIEHLTESFKQKFNTKIEPFVTTPSHGASYY